MRKLMLAILLAAAAETVALACTCIPIPTDAAERQSIASDVATGALALVEVELVRAYDQVSGRGEGLRVVQTIAGTAPTTFEAERARAPSSASCDVEFRSGERVMVLLYPPYVAGTGAEPRFRLADSCLSPLLSDQAFREALIAAMARGERG